MFGSAILETLTGMVFIFAMMSLVIMAINEQLASCFKWRAKDLQKGIESMLDSKSLSKEIYVHPVIFGLWKTRGNMLGVNAVNKGTTASIGDSAEQTLAKRMWAGAKNWYRGSDPIERPPSYIPSHQLAKAVIDIVNTRSFSAKETGELIVGCTEGACQEFKDLKEKINGMPDSQLKAALNALCNESCESITDLEKKLSNWFDNGMDRISGWYRRRVQMWSILIAAIVVIGFNVDCLEMATKLYKDAGLRSTLTVHAQTATMTASSQELLNSMGALPVGWVEAPWDTWLKKSGSVFQIWIASKVLGFIMSIAAVTLGAPFWFDLLSLLMSVRLAGGKPNKADKSGNPALS